jgi:hypothetical protein
MVAGAVPATSATATVSWYGTAGQHSIPYPLEGILRPICRLYQYRRLRIQSKGWYIRTGQAYTFKTQHEHLSISSIP